MAEERDRSKRYANPPKGRKGGMQDKDETGAEKKVEASAKAGTDVPHAASPAKAGKEGADPGPEAGKDAGWGVVAERHKVEHAGAMKRHGEESAAMFERHGKELKDMMGRHHKEMQDHFETAAAGKLESSAGSPKELGKDKDEGKKGSEP